MPQQKVAREPPQRKLNKSPPFVLQISRILASSRELVASSAMLLSHIRLHFGGGIAGAMDTCELADFGCQAAIDADLVEWNYGKYKGRLTSEILADNPDWELSRRATRTASRLNT